MAERPFTSIPDERGVVLLKGSSLNRLLILMHNPTPLLLLSVIPVTDHLYPPAYLCIVN